MISLSTAHGFDYFDDLALKPLPIDSGMEVYTIPSQFQLLLANNFSRCRKAQTKTMPFSTFMGFVSRCISLIFEGGQRSTKF